MSQGSLASIDHIMEQLSVKADLVCKFAMLYSDYLSTKRDYGSGEMINMVEVHTLTSIEENPGITITQLAGMWNRTKGAISQTATKLEQKGLIERKKMGSNAKNVLLFTTPKGQELSLLHKSYDAQDVLSTMQELRRTCSAEEIDQFFKVMECYIQLLRQP